MSWQCNHCGEINDEAVHRACWKCKTRRFASGDAAMSSSLRSGMLCSTTMEIPGREILSSKGVVFGEAILGANILRDLLAGVRDIVGGRSGTYENKLKDGRNLAITEMLDEAQSMGADAVVGIDLDYETLGQTMLMVCASGTAVILKPKDDG